MLRLEECRVYGAITHALDHFTVKTWTVEWMTKTHTAGKCNVSVVAEIGIIGIIASYSKTFNQMCA